MAKLERDMDACVQMGWLIAMAEIYPTRAGLKLLRAVAAGDVIEGIADDHTYLLRHPDEPEKVCALIEDLNAAGWVVLPEQDAPVTWRLTEAGRKVLEGADHG